MTPRTPCLIGVSQLTHRPEAGEAPEPLALWEQVCREAAADSAGRDVFGAVDSLSLVHCLSWPYDDPPGRLAARLQLPEGERIQSAMSGTSPQRLIQEAAVRILEGSCDVALVVGGEALATKKRLRRAGRRPAWSHRPAQKPPLPFADPFHPAEVAHEVFQATLTFALFEVARRAHEGLSPEENRRLLGELFAPMTAVAAAHPHAWRAEAHTPEALVDVTATNRMVAYPYAKNTVSIMDVDMAAAVLLASVEKADALGVPRDRRVYLRGWCSARDPLYVAEREELWRSPAMEAAGAEALGRAGVGIDDVAHLDLYSCFGSSVNFARDALGLAADDPRGLTVTGGLPYFGGPGSNYLTHSVATVVERLREDPEAYALVTGVGMHMTHHVTALYSGTPGPVTPPDEATLQARLSAAPVREIRDLATGPARLAAYSVVHDRAGPSFGLAACDLPEGDRCYARVEDLDLMASLEKEEWVGRVVELVRGGPKVNRIEA